MTKIAPALVDEGAELDARMKLDALRMAEIKTALVKAGPGEYFGTKPDAHCLVIFPAPRIAARPEMIGKLKRLLGKMLPKFFDAETVYKPVPGVRAIAKAMLPGEKLSAFLTLTEVECPAQVRFG